MALAVTNLEIMLVPYPPNSEMSRKTPSLISMVGSSHHRGHIKGYVLTRKHTEAVCIAGGRAITTS